MNENIIEFGMTHTLEVLELTCGHFIYVTIGFANRRRVDQGTFYCTACGEEQYFPKPAEIKQDAKILKIVKKE